MITNGHTFAHVERAIDAFRHGTRHRAWQFAEPGLTDYGRTAHILHKPSGVVLGLAEAAREPGEKSYCLTKKEVRAELEKRGWWGKPYG